jgi:hemolysin activation/secretion protein
LEKHNGVTITRQAMALKNILWFLSLWAFLPTLFADSTGVGMKLGVLPSLYFTPETRLAVGAFSYTYFRVMRNDTISRKSNTQTYMTYTQNRQFAIENDYQIFLNHGKVYLKGQIDFFHFPENFYGIGNNTRVADRQTVAYKFFKFYHKTLYKIHKFNYLGFIVDYQRQWDLSQKLMDDDSDRMIAGYNGFTGAGLGGIFLVDKRDNILNPAQGQYVELSAMAYENRVLGKYAFYNLTADVRKFQTFAKKWILNVNFYASLNFGNVPFKHTPYIGGARFLRGYYAGRFRDNHLLLLQKEWRFPIYKRFGAAVFGGMGQVAERLSDFTWRGTHFSYGAGLRYKIDKKENTNLRLDYGIGKDQRGLYIVFAEAF